jgi:hypothetical protein
LGAVGLVGDDDDVLPVGQQREAAASVSIFLGQPELLHRGEHDPAGGLGGEQLTHMLT